MAFFDLSEDEQLAIVQILDTSGAELSPDEIQTASLQSSDSVEIDDEDAEFTINLDQFRPESWDHQNNAVSSLKWRPSLSKPWCKVQLASALAGCSALSGPAAGVCVAAAYEAYRRCRR